MSDPILEADELTIQYETRDGPLTAVSDASFTVREGDFFGLVGESGCGKSTLADAIVGMLDKNGSVSSGTIRYKGEEIQDLTQDELNEKIRWNEISVIPQASMNSLDPLETIRETAIEIGNHHTDWSDERIVEELKHMFEITGLPEGRMNDYPHQFSGGMKQRVAIALALFLNPSLVIADEPSTALDVIMQDQIFKYLDEIKGSISLVLITHDISLVFESCDRLAIMHAGQVCETGTTVELYHSPHHPYSILLQEAFPSLENPDRRLSVIEGHPPQNIGTVDYCTFVNRCPWATEECREDSPPYETVGEADEGEMPHTVTCIWKDRVQQSIEEEGVAQYTDQGPASVGGESHD